MQRREREEHVLQHTISCIGLGLRPTTLSHPCHIIADTPQYQLQTCSHATNPSIYNISYGCSPPAAGDRPGSSREGSGGLLMLNERSCNASRCNKRQESTVNGLGVWRLSLSLHTYNDCRRCVVVTSNMSKLLSLSVCKVWTVSQLRSGRG